MEAEGTDAPDLFLQPPARLSLEIENYSLIELKFAERKIVIPDSRVDLKFAASDRPGNCFRCCKISRQSQTANERRRNDYCQRRTP
jgi:hypothetical protein